MSIKRSGCVGKRDLRSDVADERLRSPLQRLLSARPHARLCEIAAARAIDTSNSTSPLASSRHERRRFRLSVCPVPLLFLDLLRRLAHVSISIGCEFLIEGRDKQVGAACVAHADVAQYSGERCDWFNLGGRCGGIVRGVGPVQ